MTETVRHTLVPLQRWPWPALWAWSAGFVLLHAALVAGLPGWVPVALAWAPSLLLAWRVSGLWRRLIAVAGLPAALWLQQGAPSWPAWVWLALAAGLLALYPMSAWRDAPLFPTPPEALLGLARKLALPARARMLDAGSGLGHGLAALRRAFPRARLEGVERSLPLVLAARFRVGRAARLQRGDMWSVSWAGYDLVYLFQRPESMAGAWSKACDEMRAGSWLVSLEFPVAGVAAAHTCASDGGRPRRLFAYRVPPRPAVATQPAAAAADKDGAGACPAPAPAAACRSGAGRVSRGRRP